MDPVHPHDLPLISGLTVEQFWERGVGDDAAIDLHQYALIIEGATPDEVYGAVASTIEVCQQTDDLDTIHGTYFIAILLQQLWLGGFTAVPVPPIFGDADGMIRLLLHSEGGVRIMVGNDPDPWDPNLFFVRYSLETP